MLHVRLAWHSKLAASLISRELIYSQQYSFMKKRIYAHAKKENVLRLKVLSPFMLQASLSVPEEKYRNGALLLFVNIEHRLIKSVLLGLGN